MFKKVIKKALESRKFWSLLIGLVSTLATTKLGLSEPLTIQVIQGISVLVGSYMVGQGVADGGLKEAIAEKKRTEAPKK